ncbi:efflux transporter outer membrane subunit [Acetobacteraceae bacterium]|nr:efflux transporter outer membrane subunit [Acetobacteraceae bacterium]
MRIFSYALAGALLLASCTVGPEYKPDHVRLPSHFSSQEHVPTAEEIADMEQGLRNWWCRFNDPILDQLIDRAIKGNYNLMAATNHIMSERALRREAQAQWYPQVDADAGGGDTRYSTAIDNWPLRPGHQGNTFGAGAWQYAGASIITYGVNANWEIDVFGRISRQVEGQTRSVQASIEDRRGLLLSILSQIATDYVILRGTQERIAVVEGAIKVAANVCDMVNRLYSHGVGNNLVVAQAESELHSERARLPGLRAQEATMRHAIAVLMGEMPGKDLPELEAVQSMPKPPALPATLPSLVVANRPDIRAAERRYAVSMANIGVAVAQLYPNFNAPLNYNPNASAFYQAFSLYGQAWNFLIMASIPIMHGGQLTAKISQSRADAEKARFMYHQTVLDAFQEVEDRMTDWGQDNYTVIERYSAEVQADLARDRARSLFSHGLTSFLNVLVTEQTALNTKDEWVVSRIKRLQDAIGLYVAMGAGWQGDELVNTELPIEKHDQGILARIFTR